MPCDEKYVPSFQSLRLCATSGSYSCRQERSPSHLPIPKLLIGQSVGRVNAHKEAALMGHLESSLLVIRCVQASARTGDLYF